MEMGYTQLTVTVRMQGFDNAGELLYRGILSTWGSTNITL